MIQFYLINPATIRNVMKSVKPDQIPVSPNLEGTYNKNADDIAPTVIYTTGEML